jgi:hypothetical protein
LSGSGGEFVGTDDRDLGRSYTRTGTGATRPGQAAMPALCVTAGVCPASAVYNFLVAKPEAAPTFPLDRPVAGFFMAE